MTSIPKHSTIWGPKNAVISHPFPPSTTSVGQESTEALLHVRGHVQILGAKKKEKEKQHNP